MKNIITIILINIVAFVECHGQNISGLWSECSKNGEYTEYIFTDDSLKIEADNYKFKGNFKNQNDTIIYYNSEIGYDLLFVIHKNKNDKITVIKDIYSDDKYVLNKSTDLKSNFKTRRAACKDKRTDKEKKLDSLNNLDMNLRFQQLEMQLDSLRNRDK